MKRRLPFASGLAILAAGLAPGQARGQTAALHVNVNWSTGAPVANVRVGLATTGVTTVTDNMGHARLPLPAGIKNAAPIKLQIAPPPANLRLVSPWGGDTSVPATRFIGIVVMRRGEQVALSNGSVLYAMMSRSAARQAGPTALGLNDGGRVVRRAAFAMLPPVAPNDTPALVVPEVAEDSGFTLAQVNRAIAALPADDLDWRMVLLTAAFEYGTLDPFTTVFFEPYAARLSWGIGAFTLDGGLQRVLAQMQRRDPARFAAILGEDQGTIKDLLATHSASEAAPILSRMGVREGDTFALSAQWAGHLFELGSTPEFQRVQIEAMHSLTVQARRRTEALGFTSDRAVAVIYDLLYNFGSIRPDREAQFRVAVAEFSRVVGRPADEREKLALLNNIMVAHVPPLFRRAIALRRCALIYDKPCTPALGTRTAASYGIGWRTVGTGEPVPLANDPVILDRLMKASGWPRGEATDGPDA